LHYMIGLLGSCQATYYKYRVWADPEYKSKYCDCAGSNSYQESTMKGILTVLDHKKGSMIFNIPNSCFGILYYMFMFGITVMMLTDIWIVYLFVNAVTVVSFIGSIFLWYTMIKDVRSICVICMTIHSVNFLSFIHHVADFYFLIW